MIKHAYRLEACQQIRKVLHTLPLERQMIGQRSRSFNKAKHSCMNPTYNSSAAQDSTGLATEE